MDGCRWVGGWVGGWVGRTSPKAWEAGVSGRGSGISCLSLLIYSSSTSSSEEEEEEEEERRERRVERKWVRAWEETKRDSEMISWIRQEET